MQMAGWSLRRKLITACVLVQAVAIALLVFGSTRLLQRTLIDQAQFETRQVAALLDQAIATPWAQRDYATLQQTLDLVRSDDSIRYLVMWDHRGKVVAASGWDMNQPLPPRDTDHIDLDRADDTLHLRAPVMVGGQALGHFDLGLSTARLRLARTDFLHHSVVIGAAALVASMALMAALALAITRHLGLLARASQRVASGDFDVQVPVESNDEIGRLGASFNAMAGALKERVTALEHSESQQTLHLEAARAEQSRLTTLLGAMNGGILFTDEHGVIIYANTSFARIWSLPEIDPGTALAELVPTLLERIEEADVAKLDAMHQGPMSPAAASRELHTRDGRLIAQRMQPVATGSHRGGCIWFHDDVTAERQTQRRAHQAMHDALTGLVNRRGLYEALEHAIALSAAGGPPFSLLFIDLDDFKYANDIGGHRVGDEILAAVARALTSQMRQGEPVARLGGDEFAVMCTGLGPSDAVAVASRIVDAIAALRFMAAGQSLRVGCSIGIAGFPADARTADELVACADTAMYDAKRGGKNGWATFHSDPMRSQAESARINWNTRIHRALQDHRFVLHFQPVHRASDSRVMYHEALLRMVDEQDPSVLIAPADFIPNAERSGKIRQIDRWVFETCVGQLAAADAAVCLAANLSPRSLEDPDFAGFLRALLQARNVDPRRLHIELTETSAISDPLAARGLIDNLRKLGCAVHLDDFGSGFNSFANLKLLDVDAIKIDGSFIRSLQSDPTNRLFVSSMIEIAHSLHKMVVAEQVEDAGTLDVLRSLGIDWVQGFHLSRPSERLVDPRARPHLQVVVDARRSAPGTLG